MKKRTDKRPEVSQIRVWLDLSHVENMAAFARTHGIPLRTLWRVRGGGSARLGTLALIEAALRGERTV